MDERVVRKPLCVYIKLSVVVVVKYFLKVVYVSQSLDGWLGSNESSCVKSHIYVVSFKRIWGECDTGKKEKKIISCVYRIPVFRRELNKGLISWGLWFITPFSSPSLRFWYYSLTLVVFYLHINEFRYIGGYAIYHYVLSFTNRTVANGIYVFPNVLHLVN